MAKTTVPIELSSTPSIVDNGTATAITIDSSQNVGIGVTPSTALDVNGVINVRTSGYEFGRITTNNVDTSNGGLTFQTISSGTFSEAMRIDSSGNVGIGATDPNYKLDVRNGVIAVGSGSNTSQTNTLLQGYGFYIGSTLYGNTSIRSTYENSGNTASLEFYTSSGGSNTVERMRIDSSGNVGIGTSSPLNDTNKATLDLAGAWGGQVNISVSGTEHAQFGSDNYGSGLSCRIESADGIVFRAGSSAERMRITSGGFVKMSQNGSYHNASAGYYEMVSPDANLIFFAKNTSANPYGQTISFASSPDNNSNYFLYCEDGTSSRFYIFSDGDVQNHDNSYSGISDEKLKQDITDAGSQWDDIKNLRVRNFKFKSDVEAYGDDAKTLIGLVAQETELVSPHLVKDNPDLDEEHNDLGTVTKSIKYSVLYMKAVKALQEAMTRIEDLETRIATLEGN